MNEHDEFHAELRAVAKDVVSKNGADLSWSLVARAGWTGLDIAEELSGAGAGVTEVAVVAYELGYAATRSAFFGGVVLGVGLLNTLSRSEARDELLMSTAEGTQRVAVAVESSAAQMASPLFALRETAEGLRLGGRATFVPDACGADRHLLVSTDAAGTPVVVVVGATTPGLTVENTPVLDATRSFGTVTAQDVAVDDADVLRFSGDPGTALHALYDRAAVAVACDSVGVGDAMLAATVEYARVRQQFGQPIGSFQAVKHACADMFVELAVSRRLVADALLALSTTSPDATTAAAKAKSHSSDAAVEVVGKALQLHGGIGYTWEGGVHAHFKRAALARSLFGSPLDHRRRLAEGYR